MTLYNPVNAPDPRGYVKGDPRVKSTPLQGLYVLPGGILSDGYVTIKKRPYDHLCKCYDEWQTIVENKHNLLTNGGRDFYHNQVLVNVSAGTRGSGYVALTNTASYSPSASDTTLTGELSSNGMGRQDATSKLHTGGTNSTTIQHTFTAATSGTTGIQGSGLFNAASTGTLTHAAAFTSTDLVVGDQLQVTWTINVG